MKHCKLRFLKQAQEKGIFFVILLKLETGRTQNAITEEIVSDIDFPSSMVWRKIYIACCVNCLYDYVDREFMPRVVSGLPAMYPL